jgi:hypothetical protein
VNSHPEAVDVPDESGSLPINPPGVHAGVRRRRAYVRAERVCAKYAARYRSGSRWRSIRVEVGRNDPAEQEETLLLLALWHAVPQGLVDPSPRRAVQDSEGGALRLVQALYKRRISISRRFLLDHWPTSVRFPTTDDDGVLPWQGHKRATDM